MTTPWLVRLASQLPPTEFDPLVFCVTAVNALRLEKRIAIPTLLGEALISCFLSKDFWRFGSDKRVLAHNRQTHCVPGLKSTNHVRRAAESKILESCGREARGIAFGTEHDHMEIMIGRDRQPRAGGGVEPPLEDVTFDNQRARILPSIARWPSGRISTSIASVMVTASYTSSGDSRRSRARAAESICSMLKAPVRSVGLSSAAALLMDGFCCHRRASRGTSHSHPVRFVYLVQWRRICVNIDGRREGDVTDVTRVVCTECARIARMLSRGFARQDDVPQESRSLRQKPRGRTVVMEAGGSPGQPADHPYVIGRILIEPFKPAPLGAQPHLIHPSLRRCEKTIRCRRVPQVFSRALWNRSGGDHCGVDLAHKLFIGCHGISPGGEAFAAPSFPVDANRLYRLPRSRLSSCVWCKRRVA